MGFTNDSSSQSIVEDLQKHGAEPTKSEKDALRFWSGDGYEGIRAGKAPKTEKEIEDWIERQPGFDGALYRGIVADDLLDLKKGDIIHQRGLSSWSDSEGVAIDFATQELGFRYIFVLEKGSKKTGDIHEYSQFEFEREHIVSGSAKQRVKKVKTKKIDGITV